MVSFSLIWLLIKMTQSESTHHQLVFPFHCLFSSVSSSFPVSMCSREPCTLCVAVWPILSICEAIEHCSFLQLTTLVSLLFYCLVKNILLTIPEPNSWFLWPGVSPGSIAWGNHGWLEGKQLESKQCQMFFPKVFVLVRIPQAECEGWFLDMRGSGNSCLRERAVPFCYLLTQGAPVEGCFLLSGCHRRWA
jgi:hypothetical protein